MDTQTKHPTGSSWKYANEKEIELFNYILNRLEKNSCQNAILRVAGGWVRDKILGKESNDIDICAEGIELEKLQSILSKEEVDSSQEQSKKINSVSRQIKSNPEKYKFINTLTIKILGFSIEIAPLRSVPGLQKPGTAEKDAFGRDLTINSLFFNLKTNEIEDWTKMGLKDLKDGLIRCPQLDPIETLQADPIRMLRAIRMACRFNFQIDPSLLDALKNPKLHNILNDDISRERIYTELMKIIKGPNYVRGIQLILDSNLHTCIFHIPKNSRIKSPKEWNEETTQMSKSLFQKLIPHFEINDASLFPKEALLLGTILLPLINKQTFEIPITKFSMKDEWRWPNSLIDLVYNVIKFSGEYGYLMQQDSLDRVKIGLLLRETGKRWTQIKVLALEYSCLCSSSPNEIKFIFQKKEEELKKLNFVAFYPVWEMPSLFKTEKLMQILNLSSGPKVKLALEKMIEWQIMNYTEQFFQEPLPYHTDLQNQCLSYINLYLRT